jgi:FAD/FMN-containing dehydrogenase
MNSTVETLNENIEGDVLSEDSTSFDQARRVWNAMIDRRPAVTAQRKQAGDVQAAVVYAKQKNLTISIRGGAHNVAGHAVCDTGLMINLSQISGVSVDPEARLRRWQPMPPLSATARWLTCFLSIQSGPRPAMMKKT